MNMSYSTANNSAVSKERAVKFALLERSFRATNSANVGLSTNAYSPVLQRQKKISIFDYKSAVFQPISMFYIPK
jgi:hypothetical protein